MKVEIWSDVVCPWCYIGKRRFEEAMTQFANADNIEVEWKSFQLDPSTKTNSDQTTQEYLAKKYGKSADEVQAMTDNVTQVADSVGLDFKLENTTTANTFMAHRLIHFAASQGKQGEAKERLLRAYFTENEPIDDVKTLLKLGKEIGLGEDALATVLNHDTYTEDVKADIADAQMLGVTGVPFFAFDRKYGVSGAQSTEVFEQHLERSYQEWQSKNSVTPLETIEGKACTPDGLCD